MPVCCRYGVDSIPRMVILDREGTVVCKDACTPLMHDASAGGFPWEELPVYKLDAEHQFRSFAAAPSVLLLMDGVRNE